MKQARIAVGVKTEALSNGVGIRHFHERRAGESANQHEKRRFRQVEIRHKQVGAAKAVTWCDEDLRRALTSFDQAIFARRRFKNARDVVPTATSRPPSARHALMVRAASSEISYHSAWSV